MLLIDELDKSDLGLPNDVLHVLEDGSYDIPELKRSSEDAICVFTDDPGARTRVDRGLVECREFPVVVITRNAECEFPLVFRRRFLPLELRLLLRERLLSIAASHLSGSEDVVGDLVDDFERRVQDGGTHSVDQLLKALRRATTGGVQPDADKLLNTLAPARPHGTRPPLTAVPAPPFVAVPVPRAVRRGQHGLGLPSAADIADPLPLLPEPDGGTVPTPDLSTHPASETARDHRDGSDPEFADGVRENLLATGTRTQLARIVDVPARAAQGRGPRPRCAPPCASRRTPRCRTPAVRAGRGCVVNSRCCAPCPDRSRYGLFVSSRGPQTASRTQGRTGCSKYTKGRLGKSWLLRAQIFSAMTEHVLADGVGFPLMGRQAERDRH
ncbi:hypothetical protein [Streptomyces sp. KL116D]|uniref:hypothetical protein n=1 Tax=Streptomyces sp. KL116D TaxID=3045152 RepID=UPI003556D58B